MPIPVTAIFDLGKTNKKFFLFDENLKEIKEEYIKFPLIDDAYGFACDDLKALSDWIKGTITRICESADYQLSGLNFSTYGASLVHLNEHGKPVTPLYNYLKPFPETLQNKFFEQYPEKANNLATASPTLGMLNSVLQLYWLKHTKPELFKKVRHTLHFPQYLSYLFTGKLVAEPTSIGCHTRLWDYNSNNYHNWVKAEGLDTLLPAIVPTTHSFKIDICGYQIKTGVGIHNSYYALASYQLRSKESFLLVSTGTWSISLNPFTGDPSVNSELEKDCLNYLSFQGHAVKASRFFLGYELDHQLTRLNKIFGKDPKYHNALKPDEHYISKLRDGSMKATYYPASIDNIKLIDELFPANNWHPEEFKSFEEAYFQLIWGLVKMQIACIKLAQGSSDIRQIYVDGGLVHNEVFVTMMQHALPHHELTFSDLPLGSAYGAAVVLKEQNRERVLD